MIKRSFDIEDLVATMWPYREEVYGFFPEEWLDNQLNIALTDGNGNYGLFEYEQKGIYTGHYFYPTARGKNAKNLAKEMIEAIFTKYDGHLIRGLTPTHKRHAQWMSRQLGFTSYGVVETPVDDCEIFILTKEEWERR